MRVSVIIPTFNRSAYIRRAIDSVVVQSYPVDEIIVVDDTRSTDNIQDELHAHYGQRVRVVKAGGGLSGARKRGVQEASGDWIAFLDSDDEWMPNRNYELVKAAEQVPEDVAWIFGDMLVITDESNSTTLYGRHGLSIPESPHVFEDTLSVQYPFQFGLLQGSLIRRNVLVELNCFDEGLQSSEDLVAGFQVACRYKYAAIPSVVGKYYQTSDLFSTSATVQGTFGPDYYRARMLAFGAVVESGRRRPWDQLYADSVRGLCRAFATRGTVPKGLAAQQFRYGAISLKGVAFAVAAVFGRGGIRTWAAICSFRRKRAAARPVGKDGFAAKIEAICTERR